MVPYKSTAEEVLFEWSHDKISTTDSKVRTTLRVSLARIFIIARRPVRHGKIKFVIPYCLLYRTWRQRNVPIFIRTTHSVV